MADVFITYKSERRAAAEHLAEILADYGYSVWWDYGLISGRDFGAQIEKELRASKAVVVLWCSMAVGSEWVREEAALAKRLERVIPTFIEKVELPLGFSLSQTLDLSDWDGAPQSNRLERLLRDIGQFVGRVPKPNLEGLNRTERAWRRFGAPPLREFALIDALERKLPPRTLPSDLLASQLEPQAPPAEAKEAQSLSDSSTVHLRDALSDTQTSVARKRSSGMVRWAWGLTAISALAVVAVASLSGGEGGLFLALTPSWLAAGILGQRSNRSHSRIFFLLSAIVGAIGGYLLPSILWGIAGRSSAEFILIFVYPLAPPLCAIAFGRLLRSLPRSLPRS